MREQYRVENDYSIQIDIWANRSLQEILHVDVGLRQAVAHDHQILRRGLGASDMEAGQSCGCSASFHWQMTSDPTPVSGQELLESVARLSGLMAGFLLVLSTAYDFSYLYALGLSFNEVPTSLADHVRSALIWAPEVCLYLLVFAIYELLSRWIEGWQTEEEIVQHATSPRRTLRLRRGPAYFLFAVLVIGMIVEMLFTSSLRWLFMLFMLAWSVLSNSAIPHLKKRGKYSRVGAALFVMLPLSMLWIGMIGYSQGLGALTATKATWSASIKSEGVQKELQLLAIRRFSTNAVLVTADGHVQVVPNDSILSAQLIRSQKVPHRLCSWFSIRCNP